MAFGADYLAPRNLVAAMIPVTAVNRGGCGPAHRARGAARSPVIAVAFLAISLDVDLSPRLQRGNWRGVARALAAGPEPGDHPGGELGSAPLEVHLPPLSNFPRGSSASVEEVDGSVRAAPRLCRAVARIGFRLLERLDIDGLIVYRFVSPVPRTISEARSCAAGGDRSRPPQCLCPRPHRTG